MNEWPDARAFRENWPLLALDLLIAAWKIDNAFSLFEHSEIDIDLLYPAPLEQHDWRQVYAAELAAHPELASDLSPEREQGDGIELVLERAQLRDNERWVVRDYLSGKSIELISEDSGWKVQTLQTLLNNGLARLKWLGQATSRKRGVVSHRGQPSRTRREHVPGATQPSVGAHREPRVGGGSRSVGSLEMHPQAAGGANGSTAASMDAHGHAAPQRGFIQAVG